MLREELLLYVSFLEGNGIIAVLYWGGLFLSVTYQTSNMAVKTGSDLKLRARVQGISIHSLRDFLHNLKVQTEIALTLVF